MTEVLEAVDRLRQAAGDQTLVSRNLRIGTVNAANSTLLVPAVQDFRRDHGGTGVEVLSTQQGEIYQGLAEGSLDLGLVNVLAGRRRAPAPLAPASWSAAGRWSACAADHPLARLDAVTIDELRERAVHRDARRLPDAPVHAPAVRGPRARDRRFSTDGAEMGKLMVAEGLGVTRAARLQRRRRPAVRARA